MSASATMALPDGRSGAAGFGKALQGAVRRVTLQVVAATMAITLALDGWFVFEWSYGRAPDPALPPGQAYVSGAIVNLLMAFSIMFATFLADEMVTRGAKRLPAYGCAVVAGSAAGALSQWWVHAWLQLPHHFVVASLAGAGIIQAMSMFLAYVTWGAVIVSVYANRRSALLAAARMHAAQLERVQTQRRALESRLQALQARVEPQFLFNALAQVRESYDHDPVRGGRLLDDLIVYLRAALPQLRDSASTLGEELKLVGAYLGIVRAHRGRELSFGIDAPTALLGARMQSMILLPLIDHLLEKGFNPSARGALHVEVRREGEKLRVALSGEGQRVSASGSEPFLRDLRERLASLYGSDAGLQLESPADADPRMVLDIPYETSDGGHR